VFHLLETRLQYGDTHHDNHTPSYRPRSTSTCRTSPTSTVESRPLLVNFDEEAKKAASACWGRRRGRLLPSRDPVGKGHPRQRSNTSHVVGVMEESAARRFGGDPDERHSTPVRHRLPHLTARQHEATSHPGMQVRTGGEDIDMAKGQGSREILRAETSLNREAETGLPGQPRRKER